MRGTLVISLVLSVLMVIFALLNNQDMSVSFGFYETRGPVALILIIAFILGVVTGTFAMIPGRLKRRRRIHDLERRLERATTEPEPPDTEPTSSKKPSTSKQSSTEPKSSKSSS